MTTQKVYLPSHPLYLTLHPRYLCHQTKGINYITTTLCMILHTICMTSHSVCMTSHEHFMTTHPYKYDITSSIFMTSYPIYIISPILFHENKTTIPGISLTVFDITPLNLCGHTRSINAFIKIMEVFTLGTRMTSYTSYITPNSDFMTSIVSIQDITNTAFMTSHPIYITSHPQFMTYHLLFL